LREACRDLELQALVGAQQGGYAHLEDFAGTERQQSHFAFSGDERVAPGPEIEHVQRSRNQSPLFWRDVAQRSAHS
jgi:hypothetical protein